MSGERRPPSLCDPALLPSIVPRIQTIAQLLLQARDTPLAQDEHDDTHVHGTGADASMTEAPPTSLALGTIANDDDDDGALDMTSYMPTGWEQGRDEAAEQIEHLHVTE